MIGTLHPGCDIALKKFNWNELDIARAIRDGALASPQQYENMWLFALRITGTGFAYRKKLEEFVHRPPETYLNEEFLARCNGLPVIVNHPKGSKLDSREFAERVVGSIMLPYIKGDEVWGISRIYDASTAEMLNEHQLSTSPAVVLRAGESKTLSLDGEKVLFEGDIKLLDHLAICLVGVWDKGKDPSGVESEAIGDSQVAEEKKEESKKEDSTKKDMQIEPAKESSGGESGGATLDKMLKHLDSLGSKMDGAIAKVDDCVKRMDSMGSRMDAMENKKEDSSKADAEKEKEEDKKDAKKDATAEQPKEMGGAKETVADKKRKDEDEKKDAKVDAKADSDDPVRKRIDELAASMADVTSKLPKQLSDSDYYDMLDEQSRADGVFMQLGERAPRPLNGETKRIYCNRLTRALQKHSARWKDVDIVSLSDQAFDVAKRDIYADAEVAADSAELVPAGMLRAVERKLPGGHTEITFKGHPSAWMNRFASNRRYVQKINLMKPGA